MSGGTYGFLGLGIMGVPMCRNLIKSGAKVVIWNRTPDTARAPADCGTFCMWFQSSTAEQRHVSHLKQHA